MALNKKIMENKTKHSIKEIAKMPLGTKVYVLDGCNIHKYYFNGFRKSKPDGEEKYEYAIFTHSDSCELAHCKSVAFDSTIYYIDYQSATKALVERLNRKIQFYSDNNGEGI